MVSARINLTVMSTSVAAICHKSGGSRPPLSLLQFSFLPFPLVDSRRGLGRARSPAAKHFDAIYAVKQSYEIHIGVQCTIEISVHAEFSHRQQNGYYG